MAHNVLDLYDVLDEIGNGAFGIVRKVRRKSDGLIFARKEINFRRMNEQELKQLIAEVHILENLRHDHIVRYQGRYVDHESGYLYIITEYCGGGDLSAFIQRAAEQGEYIPEDTVWSYFMQILSALEYCHNTGEYRNGMKWNGQILHRDLKPENGSLFLLDETNTVKLGDFGLAAVLDGGSFGETFVGTPYYMSPELILGKIYDHKSDIWSLGCLIYHLCVLTPLFHEAKTQSELNELIQGAKVPSLPRNYSQSLNDVVKTMLVQNPGMRPSAAKLLKHERIRFATERQTFLMRKSKLEERELAFQDAIRNKDAEIYSLCQREMELIQALNKLKEDKDAEIQSLNWKIHHYQRREVEMYEIIQSKQKETKDAFLRRETELLEALEQRDEVMRFTRGRLEALVKCSRSAGRTLLSQY
ncbi:kinase-like domain-containing protein [Mycena olivaceomarginata]|nr:kinase-like domain-containing protein [Mycena olivaceomarginata]